MPLICFYYQISASLEKMFLLKSVLLSLIKYMKALIKNLIKVWFRRCKKKLLSVISCHCPDKAIYTDLFTLTPGEKGPIVSTGTTEHGWSTPSGLSLKLTSRINLGRRDAHTPSSRFWTKSTVQKGRSPQPHSPERAKSHIRGFTKRRKKTWAEKKYLAEHGGNLRKSESEHI